LLDGSHCEPLPHLDILVAAHPEYPEPALGKHFRFLRQKIEAGADGMIANIVTDPDAFFRYRDRAQAAGIDRPIVPSLLPLNSARRCEFLTQQLHIPVPPAIAARLRGASRDAAQALALDGLVASLRRLLGGGAPAVNFNIVVPSDADAVVAALQAFRGA
jgi:methylenetetrahydrofolate reductase (NADPH)